MKKQTKAFIKRSIEHMDGGTGSYADEVKDVNKILDGEPKEKITETPTYETPNYLAEQVWDRVNPAKYLTFDFTDKTISEQDQIILRDTDEAGRAIIYKPIDNDMLRKGTVIVPRTATPCELKDVLEEADNFVSFCYDPCGQEDMVKLLTRIVLGSWFLDGFTPDLKLDIAGAGKFAPIIPIHGASQSGKNRLLFCLRMLSYRPYYEVSTCRIPSLYRPLDLWRGTLCLDEADFRFSDPNSEIAQFLNSRAQGTPYSRQDPDRAKITNIFTSFGITILTARRVYEDNAIHTRSVPFYSLRTIKKLPTLETQKMLEIGLALQDKLLYLRFKYHRDLVIDKEQWLEGVKEPRLMSALLPLLALSKYEPKMYSDIAGTIKKVSELKVREKAISEDGTIINYLWDRAEEGLVDQWNGNYYFKTQVKRKVTEDGHTSEVTKIEPLSTSIMEYDLKWKSKQIRKVVQGLNLVDIEALNLGKKIRPEGSDKPVKCIFFDPARFEMALTDFVVSYKEGELGEAIGYNPSQTHLNNKGPQWGNALKCGTSGTSGTKLDENVPDVPDVPDKTPIPPTTSLRKDVDPSETAPSLTHSCGTVIIEPPADTTDDMIEETCPGCHQPYILRRAYPDGWRFLKDGREE